MIEALLYWGGVVLISYITVGCALVVIMFGMLSVGWMAFSPHAGLKAIFLAIPFWPIFVFVMIVGGWNGLKQSRGKP